MVQMRTTAPRRYAVRPNIGLLPPVGQEDIQIVLNGSPEVDAAINSEREKSQQKDRFLLVCFAANAMDISGAEALKELVTLLVLLLLLQRIVDLLELQWQNVEDSKIQKIKLKVRFKFDTEPSGAKSTPSTTQQQPPTTPVPLSSISIQPHEPKALNITQLQSQILKAEAPRKAAEATETNRTTNQEKYLQSLQNLESFTKQQLSNPEVRS